MQHIKILKKYSNRRLYDTQHSKYVTLDAVRNLIQDGNQVKIIDANTKQDVTAFILIQVILEQARCKNILLPVSLLHLVIQYGDNIMRDFFDKYLQQVIEAYLTCRKTVDDQFRNWLTLGSKHSNTTRKSLHNLNSHDQFLDNSHPDSKDKEVGKV